MAKVKIKTAAFSRCTHLTTVILNEGLEESGAAAFRECTSLKEISIPHTIKAIKDVAFNQCTQLSTVMLGVGLKEIGKGAFSQCTLLHEILAPPVCQVDLGWGVRSVHAVDLCDS